MAWLEQHPTSGRFKLCFRWGGRQFKKTIKTTQRSAAESLRSRLEENIALVERGRLVIPPGADLATFLVSDGKMTAPPKAEIPLKPLTLAELRDSYLAAHSQGAMEANSLATVAMHLGHFLKSLGKDFAIGKLTQDHLQQHVDQRGRKKYRGRTLSPVTLRKEMASFRACWNWGVQAGKLTGTFPSRALKYPKMDEKEPFQSWEEIERKIARGGLTERQKDLLWDCVFLSLPEVTELLAQVRGQARVPFLYPMFVFAAHTGARRSEMLRIQVGDVDLGGRTVLLREKKRVRGVRTMRRVPLSPLLVEVLQEWLGKHPGGQHLFCQFTEVQRSRKKRTGPTPVTRDEANDHFRRTVAGSKWEVLRGWHVFRHSFCSNCAAAGVDQRLIDSWVGHTTEEMRRRYRHLLPNQERQALQTVFGQAVEKPRKEDVNSEEAGSASATPGPS